MQPRFIKPDGISDARHRFIRDIMRQRSPTMRVHSFLQLRGAGRGSTGQVVSPGVFVMPQHFLVSLEQPCILIRVIRQRACHDSQRFRDGHFRMVATIDSGGQRGGGGAHRIILPRYLTAPHRQVTRQLREQFLVKARVRAGNQPWIRPAIIPRADGTGIPVNIRRIVARAADHWPAQHAIGVSCLIQRL
ncbi:MAG: hypothetical protein BWY76_01736 [bacterium ADurb.Bin429]|nr:MAG: hypothetical protein BWY76_01736 [bacterium ADurb.Bin429]